MIFAFLVQSNHAAVKAAIQSNFPINLEVAPDQFLVAASGTTVQVGERIGISAAGSPGQVIVLAVSSFWGWQDNSIWDWMASNWATPG